MDAANVDVILTTGFEAAGHRPSFLARAEDSLMGTLALTRIVAGRINRPVIAAGGMSDRAGVDAAMALGAGAAQLGTAFLATQEVGNHRCASRCAVQPAAARTFTAHLFRPPRTRHPQPVVGADAPIFQRLPPFPIRDLACARRCPGAAGAQG